MTPLLALHLLALGIWLGVVGAEFVIEADGNRDDRSFIKAAKMHYATDLWVEIPAFMTVLITGLLMLNESHLQGAFLVKVIFGVLAVAFNGLCVYAVFKRRQFALNEDVAGMRSVDPVMKVSALVIPTFLIAFGLGIYSVFS